ncbi:MAG TPA: ParB N-terminal domain-containing protein [Vicinamibacteria bacterium]|nr:ParB N-terminal domain-containing protein [Vicinamibacteria bacterium]
MGSKSPESSTDSKKDEEYYESDMSSTAETRYQREGLPQEYRMRHDDHYVTELVASGHMPRLRIVAINQIESSAPAGGEGLQGLVDSIREFGVLQPLIVRRHRGRYELLSGAKRLAAAASAGLREVPCLVHDVDELEARRLAEAANRHARLRERIVGVRGGRAGATSTILESTFETILSTLGLLDRPDNTLRDQVAIGLIRTETMRAQRLVRGVAMLNADPPVIRRAVDMGAVLRDVLSESEDERRLLGLSLSASIDADCTGRADAQLLGIAMAGALETVTALLRSSKGASLQVRLSRNEMIRGVTLSVSEDVVRMPTSSWSRWFDLDWEERPGGYAAGIALLSAKRAAELHGGRLELAPTQSGGCRISVVLPAEA